MLMCSPLLKTRALLEKVPRPGPRRPKPNPLRWGGGYPVYPALAKSGKRSVISVMHLVMAFMAEANHIPTGPLPLWILLQRVYVMHCCRWCSPAVPSALPAHIFVPAQSSSPQSLPLAGFIYVHGITPIKKSLSPESFIQPAPPSAGRLNNGFLQLTKYFCLC